MNRRQYLRAIAVLFGGSIAGCADIEDDPDMSEQEAKDVFTEREELDVDDMGTVAYAERFVDEEYDIVFHAFEPSETHAGDGTAVTSNKIDPGHDAN